MLREGDTLKVWELDRQGWLEEPLVDPVGESYKQGIPFRNLTESIDTGMRSRGMVRVGLLWGLDAYAPHGKIAMVTA